MHNENEPRRGEMIIEHDMIIALNPKWKRTPKR
jgi:hypothetical protein